MLQFFPPFHHLLTALLYSWHTKLLLILCLFFPAYYFLSQLRAIWDCDKKSFERKWDFHVFIRNVCCLQSSETPVVIFRQLRNCRSFELQKEKSLYHSSSARDCSFFAAAVWQIANTKSLYAFKNSKHKVKKRRVSGTLSSLWRNRPLYLPWSGYKQGLRHDKQKSIYTLHRNEYHHQGNSFMPPGLLTVQLVSSSSKCERNTRLIIRPKLPAGKRQSQAARYYRYTRSKGHFLRSRNRICSPFAVIMGNGLWVS